VKRFLPWAALALPFLLALFLAAGCSEAPPRTPKQMKEEARQASQAAQKKDLAAKAERRQNSASDRASDRTGDAETHELPDLPGQDEDTTN
jgi:hypothetical protein